MAKRKRPDGAKARRRLYLHNFVAGPRGVRGNARKAAVAAGYKDTPGIEMTLKAIHKDPAIIQALQDYFTRWDLTDERIVAEYCRIAFADLADVIEFNTETGELQIREGGDLDKLGPEITAAIAEIKPTVDQDGNVRYGIKMHDKKGALDFLAKLRGLIRTPETNVVLIQMMANLNLGVFSTEELRAFRDLLGRALPPGMSTAQQAMLPPGPPPPDPPPPAPHRNGSGP